MSSGIKIGESTRSTPSAPTNGETDLPFEADGGPPARLNGAVIKRLEDFRQCPLRYVADDLFSNGGQNATLTLQYIGPYSNISKDTATRIGEVLQNSLRACVSLSPDLAYDYPRRLSLAKSNRFSELEELGVTSESIGLIRCAEWDLRVKKGSSSCYMFEMLYGPNAGVEPRSMEYRAYYDNQWNAVRRGFEANQRSAISGEQQPKRRESTPLWLSRPSNNYFSIDRRSTNLG
ncbi:hypothetical protein M231_03469 [Tremella mesenterica]|uniref:Uncharacterized protein n=1 Tax=Tremella mesenterica TaxID=5217 RepID=A0A4Q1BN27_TREME|nr:uncharacterized protein TREMEDRAFT_58723 [Tremella mesenterica DSM 1558]EIW72550.1 hypothetical protein TREMEDRAFT_58723 [Tremella mesenterica DSM 1558]RXK39249.1 hypothetical protein M231_03469 [Tremella mesenterica]